MPTTFTDRKGRTWDVSLDIAKARRITDSDFTIITGEGSGRINILRPSKDTLTRVLLDAQLLAAVCWCLVQEQADKKYDAYSLLPDNRPANPAVANTFPISPRESAEQAELEFVSGFNGATIAAAREALTEALADFFPEMKIALFALLKQLKGMDDLVGRKMENLTPMLDQLMEAAMDEGIEKLKAELLSKKSTTTGETSMPLQPTPVSVSPISGIQASPSGTSS